MEVRFTCVNQRVEQSERTSCICPKTCAAAHYRAASWQRQERQSTGSTLRGHQMYTQYPRMCHTRHLSRAWNRPHCTASAKPSFWHTSLLLLIFSTGCSVRRAGGEDEFRPELLHSGLNAKFSKRTDGFLFAVYFWKSPSAVPQHWLPLLFNPPHDWLRSLNSLWPFPFMNFSISEILIKAEPPVTSWFPLAAAAATNIKADAASLSWGQGVKLDNWLFVCGFSL